MDKVGSLSAKWAQGYDATDIQFIDASTICYVCGSVLKFVNIVSKIETVFQSPGNGISCFAASSTHKVFAIAEANSDPQIFICRFPTMEVIHVLKGGTLLEYSMLEFSIQDTYLATFSGIPDFSLTVWDWSQENILCTHEFGEDNEIKRISFNPTNDHHLVLMGKNKITIFTIEKCNLIYNLKMRNVALPCIGLDAHNDGASRPATRMGFQLQLSHAARAGLVGTIADDFEPRSLWQPRMTPASVCWTNKGEFFVGSHEGFLFSVDIDTAQVKTYLDSTSQGKENTTFGMYNTLCINASALFAGGIDGVLRKVTIDKSNNISYESIWQAPSSILTCAFSPVSYTELAIGLDSGSLWTINSMDKSSECISQSHVGKFIGAGYSFEENQCVSCREDGVVEIWQVSNGTRLSVCDVQTRATAVAVCPSCPVAAVGSWDGYIYFIDLSNIEKPRIISRERLHKGAVSFLSYSTDGMFLVCSSVDDHEIFILNSLPSQEFDCIGYVDCGGPVKNITLSNQNGATYVTAVVTPTYEADEEEDGSEPSESLSDRLTIFNVPSKVIENPTDHHESLRKNFKDESVSRLNFDLTVSVDSAVLFEANSHLKVLALNQNDKKLNYFKLPNHAGSKGGKAQTQKIKMTRKCRKESTDVHNPAEEYTGHELEGGSLRISPHGKWISSYSADGLIKLRHINAMGKEISQQAHSFLKGGIRSLVISMDGQSFISVGNDDNCILCFQWHLTPKGKSEISLALEYARLQMMQLRSVADEENPILAEFYDWEPEYNSPGRGATATSKPDSAISETDINVETTPKDRATSAKSTSRSEVTMTPTPVPAADATWLETQLTVAIKQENAQFDEAKRNLRYEIKTLKKTILEMMKQNLLLPEIEQLSHEEYNLDVEEQARLQSESDKKIQDIRETIELENLAQQYLKYLIQKECWDDMEVKGRALMAFNNTNQVTNYSMLPRPKSEEELLQKIERIRNIEIAENKIRNEIVEIPTTSNLDEEDEEEYIPPDAEKQLSLHGSIGPNYGGASDLFYSQFDLHSREEKISQIVLLKNAIRLIKTSFNETFNSVYRNKTQEINRIKEKNVRIREILQELGMQGTDVKDPELNNEEQPEKVLVVEKEEVKVELVLSVEQQKEKEEQDRIEEEKRKAAQGDNKRERGLKDMMDGVLEVKKEDLLKQDLPPPEFIQEKLEKDWTDEEKKAVKEYEKKMKDLEEEREKYRKNLENELKKLQQNNIESTNSFDEALLQLYNRKIKVDMAVNQEELKILRLTKAILIDDEINAEELYLNDKLKRLKEAKAAAAETVIKVEKEVEIYQETYDSITAEDKLLERGFKRDFSDVPLSLVDQLYKLFKRRPRIQRHREEQSFNSQNPYGASLTTSVGVDGRPSIVNPESSATILEALSELDDISNAPEGCAENVWERLCHARRNKTESELRVKSSASVLAGMTQYLNERQAEDESFAKEIEEIVKRQNKLCEDRMKNNLNLEVQFLLKQGQVEVHTGDFIPDYSDCILMHRAVVEDLNGTIKTLGETKIAAMNESKDFKKGIHQLEWERKRMMMQMEDLHNKTRRVQNLKLTKDLQVFLNEENQQSRQSREISVLEQTLALQDKHFDKDLGYKKSIAEDLETVIEQKERSNQDLDEEIQELHVSVSERRNINEVNASERAKNTADKRLHGIVQRRKLVDLAKAQAQEVAVLRAEVERLRMKTFPALVQVER